MTGFRSAAEIRILFKRWVIPHRRASETMSMMDQLREQKRKLPWGFEARAAHLLAPSHSGKTHAVYHNYYETRLIPELRQSGQYGPDVTDDMIRRLQKKVVYVKVPSEFIGSFALALLRALGDPKRGKDSVDERIERAETQMESLGTELLVVDSFDNLTRLGDAESARQANRTQGRLRLMLENGMPMLFVGMPSARNSILNEEQLSHRIDEIAFGPLQDPEDVKEFGSYLIGLDLLLVDSQITSDMSDLDQYFDPLFIAGRRRYGVTSSLVRDAAILASNKKASYIHESHLADAVTAYLERTPRKSALASDDLSDFNPFTGKQVPYSGGAYD